MVIPQVVRLARWSSGYPTSGRQEAGRWQSGPRESPGDRRRFRSRSRHPGRGAWTSGSIRGEGLRAHGVQADQWRREDGPGEGIREDVRLPATVWTSGESTSCRQSRRAAPWTIHRAPGVWTFAEIHELHAGKASGSGPGQRRHFARNGSVPAIRQGCLTEGVTWEC